MFYNFAIRLQKYSTLVSVYITRYPDSRKRATLLRILYQSRFKQGTLFCKPKPVNGEILDFLSVRQ
jgi:hypothetical protein